jgi:hypothetical protein
MAAATRWRALLSSHACIVSLGKANRCDHVPSGVGVEPLKLWTKRLYPRVVTGGGAARGGSASSLHSSAHLADRRSELHMSLAPFDLADLRVDPTGLDAAARGVGAAARELSAALTVLNTAWAAASSGLVGTRSGIAMDACRPAAFSAGRSWADAVAELAAGLAHAAGGYRADDRAAVPAPRSPASGEG